MADASTVKVKLELDEGQLTRLLLQPSEVLVFHPGDELDYTDSVRVRNVLADVFPHNKVLVVGPRDTFTVIDEEAV